jgi:hypothetical protein
MLLKDDKILYKNEEMDSVVKNEVLPNSEEMLNSQLFKCKKDPESSEENIEETEE